MSDHPAELDKYIKQLVQNGDRQAAVKKLYDAIVSEAKNRNFDRAEELRELLYEVDAMALTEIVKAGEIIEQEKSRSIDFSHRQIWSALYASLTKEEANTFFYTLEDKQIDTGQTAIAQGQLPEGLLFINQGRAKIVWKHGTTEVLLAILNPGSVAGHDTFFDISIATTSLIALTPLHYSLLRKEKTKSWDPSASTLLYRLKEYCRQIERPCDLVKKKGVERRKHQRIRVTGKIKLQLISSAGATLGKPFTGQLLNLSEGGLSFQILVSTQPGAAMLLGRGLQMTFASVEKTVPDTHPIRGTITGVTDLMLNEYAVHVRFETPVSINSSTP
jgi:hypothetical protein